MTRKSKQVTGYRLHKDRILFSGGQITRSIKFPLRPFQENSATEEIKQKFEEAVIADDLRVRGDLNLNDFLTYTHRGNPPYTLADFWVDSLRVGVVWADGSAQLVDLVASLYHSENKVYKKIFAGISKKFTRYFDAERFIEKFISKYPEIMRKTTPEKFRELFRNALKDQDSKEGRRLIEKIIGFIFKDGTPSKEKQLRLILHFLGGEYSYIETLNPERITFFVVPQLKQQTNTDIEPEQLIKEREEFFRTSNLSLKFTLSLGLANQEVDYEDLVKKGKNLPQTKFNGFSNYLNKIFQLLLEEDIEQIFELLLRVYPPIKKEVTREKVEIMESLQFLSKCAQRLGQPQLPGISGWHDYRSVFGGKIKSWLSNYLRREKELEKQEEDFKKSLKVARKYLKEATFSEEAKDELKGIKPLLERLEELLKDHTLSSKAVYQTFDDLLSALKRLLNFFYQIYIREEADDTPVNEFKELKGLYARIYRPMSFFGTAKKEENEKITELTIPILEDGIKMLSDLFSSLKKDFSPRDTFDEVRRKKEKKEDLAKKQLGFLWRKYKGKAINSSVFEKKYTRILRSALKNQENWKEINKNKTRCVFYRSPSAKGTLSEVKLKSESLDLFESVFDELFTFASQFNKDELLSDSAILLDWLDLSRNLLASLIRFNTKGVFNVERFNLENFKRARNYRRLFSLKQVRKVELAFFIQSFILSELKGSATLFSKKKYLARYTVQVVGADRKFRLFYSSKGREIDPAVIKEKPVLGKRKNLVIKPHQYLVALDRVGFQKPTEKAVVYLNLGKTGLALGTLKPEQRQNLFRLASSPYQLQFLDKFIFRSRGWENIDINLGEWMFIVEREYKIDWDLENGVPICTLDSNSRKNRLYVAIPFQLASKSKVPALASLDQKNKKRASFPILGVDVGEYGLAWVLAKFKDEKVRIINKGFVEDQNIAKIKDKFAAIQQRARKGAFDEQSSVVALVRENAIGRLRNRLHLVLTQAGSSVTYEYSISNFETGSGRTTKIYHSVKRADVDFGTDADKREHSHVWGERTEMLGKSLSAYASSYTCSKCLRSLYQIRQADLEEVKIIAREGNILTLTSSYGELNAYSQKKEKYKESFQFKNTKDSLKEFKKLVRDFSRPPVDKKSEVLAKFASELDNSLLAAYREKRGNSSVFICPFSDCHHKADADIQAALMMAVRGYLNYSGKVKSGEKSGESYLEETVKLLSTIAEQERPVVGLNLSSKD